MMRKAYDIAVRDLTALYAERGIHAGKDHFTDYWARDSMYACLGALSIANPDDPDDRHLKQVRLNLELLEDYQNEKTGQIPLRVGSGLLFLKMLGIGGRKLGPKYKQDKAFLHPFDDSLRSTDPNSLFLIVSSLYLGLTDDADYLETHFEAFERAMEWSIGRTGEGVLMKEGSYSTWEDTVAKKGEVLYTNVLYYAALRAFARICEMKGEDTENYGKMAQQVKVELDSRFWNGNYYIDWIDGDKRYDYFSTDGNALALLFGLPGREKAEKMLHYMAEHQLNEPMPSRTCHTAAGGYPAARVSRLNRLFGMENYHSRWTWPWLGCIGAAALHRAGKGKEAKELLAGVGDVIIRDGVCHEVHGLDQKPVHLGKRFRSEAPFAWTAGTYLFACHQIHDDTNRLAAAFERIFS